MQRGLAAEVIRIQHLDVVGQKISQCLWQSAGKELPSVTQAHEKKRAAICCLLREQGLPAFG
jgi:hypothetical protein